jgi:uncharacterized OB-fold protein
MEKTSANEKSQTRSLIGEGLFEYPVAESRIPALVANRCSHCGKAFFPKRPLCPYCFEKGKMEEIKLDRRGIIYACTVVHRDSPTGIKAPYAYGYVDIPVNKVRVFGLFTGTNPSSFTPGQELELIVEPIKIDPQGEEIIGYKFKPVGR